MQRIVIYFWQLCLLRENPGRIPPSHLVLAGVLGCYLFIAVIAVSIGRPALSIIGVLGTIAIGMSVQAGITAGLLAFKQLGNRFIATWTALIGTNAIMLVILLPVNLTLLNSDNNDTMRMLADSVSWVCLGWWLAIVGYIYHKATNISILQGSAIAFISELAGVLIAVSAFPTQ